MKGPTRVVFMPIAHDDVIDISGMDDHTNIHEVGFKPGPARSRSGWLVLLVHEGEAVGPRSPYNGDRPTIKIPKAAAPRKLRGTP